MFCLFFPQYDIPYPPYRGGYGINQYGSCDHWMGQGINPLILLLGWFDFLDPAATAATLFG